MPKPRARPWGNTDVFFTRNVMERTTPSTVTACPPKSIVATRPPRRGPTSGPLKWQPRSACNLHPINPRRSTMYDNGMYKVRITDQSIGENNRSNPELRLTVQPLGIYFDDMDQE